MGQLRLSFACGDYDRMQPLKDGTVRVEGIDLNYVVMPPNDLFWRMLKYQEFDVSEMSMCNLIMRTDQGDSPFWGIPVFPSRLFRHSNIYVNTACGIKTPQDLAGRRVGAPDYHLTALLWTKGMLEHEYGVRPRDVHWLFGALDCAGIEDRVAYTPPAWLSHEFVADRALGDLLVRGEIDALIGPRSPAAFLNGSPQVARLFPNYMQVEMEYYRRHHYFPIMHTVVIRKDVYAQNPWAARSILNACHRAKEIAIARLWDDGTLMATVPWLIPVLEQHRELMGEDWWPYGLEENRHTLEAMVQYAFEQGLTTRRVEVDEVFAPNTRQAYSQEVLRHRQ